MTAPFPFGVTVEVERGSRDRFGDIAYAVSHTIPGCAVAPRSSSEDNDARTSVIVGLTLYGPYGADLQSDDRVVIPGPEPRARRTWRVIGEAGSWHHPMTNWKPGFEAALERVS